MSEMEEPCQILVFVRIPGLLAPFLTSAAGTVTRGHGRFAAEGGKVVSSGQERPSRDIPAPSAWPASLWGRHNQYAAAGPSLTVLLTLLPSSKLFFSTRLGMRQPGANGEPRLSPDACQVSRFIVLLGSYAWERQMIYLCPASLCLLNADAFPSSFFRCSNTPCQRGNKRGSSIIKKKKKRRVLVCLVP